MEDLVRTYFKILESASLEDVLAAAKVCATKCRTFPKPVDWLDALPEGVLTDQPPDMRVMGEAERRVHYDAERSHYEGPACDCLLCQAAGMTSRPLRFVPDFTLDDLPERAFDPERNRIVHVGHWAHGHELARWYAARSVFFASVTRKMQTDMARALLVLVPHEREPGEEG